MDGSFSDVVDFGELQNRKKALLLQNDPQTMLFPQALKKGMRFVPAVILTVPSNSIFKELLESIVNAGTKLSTLLSSLDFVSVPK